MDSSSESRPRHRPCHVEIILQPQQNNNKRSSGLLSKKTMMFPLTILLSTPLTVNSSRNLALVSHNPFLPDYTNNLCKNDKPAESWATAVAVTVEACCKLHFSWIEEICQANSREWALENPQKPVLSSKEDEEEDVPMKYWADTTEGICKLDGPDRPTWTQVKEMTHTKCCQDYLSWSLEKCLDTRPKLPDDKEQEEKVVPSFKFYADTTDGICKLDGPDRPSWLTAHEIPYEKCCQDYLSWSLQKCMAAKPVLPNDDIMVPNSSSAGKKFYPDPIKGYCLEDGPKRPSWAKVLEDDYTTCCENHFYDYDEDFLKCIENMPVDAGRKPTANPTKAPVTLAPVPDLYFTPAPEATNPTTPSPTTQRPTHIPTSNVVCSDQSLSKSQCESNPKCIWWLKQGTACTYKAWVQPTAKPTPRPTFAPVITYEFYNVPGTGLCAFNDESKPAWITSIYTDWDECCEKESWDKPKCLAAKPEEVKELEMQQHSTSTGSSDDGDYVIIDITMYGSMTLDKLILPDVISPKWTFLKRVLTKSLILTLAYDTSLVHPNVEVELWSVGDQEFTWRRLLAENEEVVDASSSLRGSPRERRVRQNNKTQKPVSEPPTSKPTKKPTRKNKKTKKPTSEPTPLPEDMTLNSSLSGSSYKLKFAVVVPTKCDSECQISGINLGENEAIRIEEHLREFVRNNYFGVQLKKEGKAVGLFLDSLPKASDVSLTYRYAAKSGGELTWAPSLSPTNKPTVYPTPTPTMSTSPSSSARPSGRTYYPDYENHICIAADGTESEFEVNFFPTLKECCKFKWIHYKTCMQMSFTNPPTSRPSSKPSLKPTKGPKTKRPTPKPTAAKTSAPTLRPISMNSSPTGLGGVVYYPDIYLGVCKSDGNYGDIPYKFSSAEACCKNNYMDYFKCMAYASPKKYFPNPWKGYCEEADSTENSLYIYTTAEECCQSGMVGEYDACVLNTRNQSGPVSTKPPTRSPNSSSTPGNYYPDFMEGFCRSDGMHEDKPYVFASAEKCCKNAAMNYNDCIDESIKRFGEAAPTTPQPTSKPTKHPSSKPTKKPTMFPTPSPTPPLKSFPGSYYPDFTEGFCRSDGLHELKPFVFTTAEHCCNNALMNYASCVVESIQRFQEAPPTTPSPTHKPTPLPPAPPGNYYPDFAAGFCRSDGNHKDKPFVFPAAEKCCDNDVMNYDDCILLSIAHFQTTMYYPDFTLKVCKSDGNHGGSMYSFSSAHDCCDSNYMDYDKCMTYAAGYLYVPLPLEGHCRIAIGTESIAYKYNNPEDCCDTGMMGDVDDCILLTVDKLGGADNGSNVIAPSTTTTTTSTKSSESIIWYADLVLKVCKSDGKQGVIPYLFSSAHTCCANKYMDYDQCMAYANGDETALSKPTTTTTTTTTPQNPFYPDMVLKVCKSDGNQGQIPLLFSTAHECCANKIMDYEKCIAYATGDTSSVSTTTTSTTVVYKSPPPTQLPTQKPSPIPPSSKPTGKPVVLENVLDARTFSGEVSDGFENGIGGVFPWQTTANNPWTLDSTHFKEGTQSARSSVVSPGETSDLYLAVDSNHGGTFSFSMRSDIQMPYSGFYVNLDDKSKMGYTFPTNNWRDLSVAVDAGYHVLMFRTWAPTSATGMSSTTSGTVYIDKVSFTPHLVEDFESKELSWAGAQTNWSFDTSRSHGGSVSLSSPDLSCGQVATMSYEFTTAAKGSTVEFFYYSEISGLDIFQFMIDGHAVLQVNQANANDTWKLEEKKIMPGVHKLEWSFACEGNSASKVWIDDIRILPLA